MYATANRVLRAALIGALVLAGACEATDLDPSADPGVAHAQDRQERDDFENAVPCFARADRETLLSDDQAFSLCFGARSYGPVECYLEARRGTGILDPQAIQLCRCAQGTQPVQCFRQADAETFLLDGQIVAMCRPIAADRLTEECVPIREL